MSLSLVGPGQDGSFVPLASLPRWNRAMGLAEMALRRGNVAQAETLYEDALDQVRQIMACGDASDAPACVAALVSSSLCLSELRVDQQQAQQAVAALAQTHETLIGLMLEYPRGNGWHRAAAQHSRETHEWLVRQWQEHGPHPDIERALRKACVLMRAPRPVFH